MPRKLKWDFDCAVIGGGPAGLASALFLARYRRKTALFRAGTPRVCWAPMLHNLPGFRRPIPGAQLHDHFQKQLRQYRGICDFEEEASVKRCVGGFEITSKKQGTTFVKKVILATGITDVHPPFPNLVPLRRAGALRYCSVCDGYEMSDREVLVIANDHAGIEKAAFIGNWTKKLKILVPQGKRLAAQSVELIHQEDLEVLRYEKLRARTPPKGRELSLWVDGRVHRCAVVYVELGCNVNDSAVQHLRNLKRTTEGFIITSGEQRTSVHGLYAAGDCVNRLGQVSVAVGQAAVVANHVHEDLLSF